MPRTLLRIGAVIGFAVLVAVVAFLLQRPGAPAPGAPPPAEPPKAEAASGQSPSDEPEMVNDRQRDRAARLLGEARRLAAAGKLSEADAALEEAEKAAAGLAEIGEMRRALAELATPQGQLKARLQRARLALEHDDRAAARQAVAEAEALAPDAPEIAEMRQALEAADRGQARRHARVAELIVQMHEAIARRDFAAAHGALNAAERIDLAAPSLAKARRELARAEEQQG